MNIMSMYSDIDLDANGMETEFQAASEELLWFIKVHLKNTGVGDFMNEEVNIIFNRDILINESEAIDNISKSEGIISDETRIKQHPWIDDPVAEIEKLDAEKKKAVEEIDTYRNAFENGKKGTTDNGGDDGEIDEQ
ncbi:MAG: phage portal protein, partial [Oscillospiraceae bacterium]|nr:phage portal protein [Oscillospiraceae bacterium]